MIIDPNVHLSDAVKYLKRMISDLQKSIFMYMHVSLTQDDEEYQGYIDELNSIHENLEKRKKTPTREEIENISVRVEDIAICAFPPSPSSFQHTGDPPIN